MALSIKKSSDIDRSKLMSCAPARRSATKQIAFINNINFNVQKTAPTPDGRGKMKVENAMVVLQGDGTVKMYLSPDFASSLDSYYDLYTLIFHELTHIVVGHLLEEKINDQYKGDFWKTQQGHYIRTIANELLIKHIEHNVLEDDKYHKINEKTFGNEELPWKIFWRDAPDHEIDDPFFLRLKKKVFSKSSYSTQETARGLKYYLPDSNETQQEGEEGEEGSSDSGEEGESQGAGSPGKEDDDGQSGQEKESEEDDDGSDEENDELRQNEGSEDGSPDTIGSQSYIEGNEEANEALQKALEALADEIQNLQKKRNTPSNPFGKKRDIKKLEDKLRKYRIKNEREVKRVIRKNASMPSVYGEIGNIVRNQIGRAEEQSVLPDYRNDKRAAAAYSAGKYVSHYRRKQAAVEKKFVVYYDISPSQDAYIPYCNEIIKRIKKDLWKNSLFTFSGRNNLQKVTARRFTKLAQMDKVSEKLGDGSTDFRQVQRHILEHNFKKVIVITDNGASLHGQERDKLKSHFAKEGHALVIVFTVYSRSKEATRTRWEGEKGCEYGFAGTETKMIGLHYEE